jgi:hypothetical protein
VPGDEVFEAYWRARNGLLEGPRRGRLVKLPSFALSAARIARTWPYLPVVSILLSPTRSGQRLGELLGHRVGSVRLGRPFLSVLELPDDHGEYLSGRRRERVRTNLHRATDAGVCIESINDLATMCDAYAVCNGRPATEDGTSAMFMTPGAICLGAKSLSGDPLALALVLVDNRDAYLARLVSNREHDGAASSARWAVHVAATRALVEAGAKRLWAEGPLLVGPGLQVFQRRLGYTCARVRFKGPASP